jgi:hemolysin D
MKSVGPVVRNAETRCVRVPLDAPLEAEVAVSPADVGEIRMKDAARVKIDAHPFHKQGTITGKVGEVSAETFNRQGVLGGQASHNLAPLRYLPSPTRRLPGMTRTAEIVTGKRTVISYFLYPLIRVLDESLRER